MQFVLKKNGAPELYFNIKRNSKSKTKLPKFKKEFNTIANHADADLFVSVLKLNFRFVGIFRNTEPESARRNYCHPDAWVHFIFRITRSLRRIDVSRWSHTQVIPTFKKILDLSTLLCVTKKHPLTVALYLSNNDFGQFRVLRDQRLVCRD